MNPLDPSCPYTTWEPSTLQWCEAQLCSYIREPANTWSNLGYILVGLWMLWHSRQSRHGHIKLLGIFSILIGLMSAFYHATSSFTGEALDYSAMFFVSTFFICTSLARLRHWSYRRVKYVAIGVLIPSIVLLLKFKFVGALLFGLQITAGVLIEFHLYRVARHKQSYKPFLISLASFLTAYGVWNLDRLRIVCDPNFHYLSGHAVWHLLSATALYFMYRYFNQFPIGQQNSEPA